MRGIDILVNEHENVLKFSDNVKEKCIKIFNGSNFNIEYFENVLEFGRNFVDKFHHKKEEDILFCIMTDELGEPIKHVIKEGMLFEHQVGRMFLSNLEYSINDYKMFNQDEYKLKIISNAYNYAILMEEHIVKENEIVYPYAENNLNINIQDDINTKIAKYEEVGYNNGIQNKYMNLLDEIIQS